jgi:hypothetical protein
VNAEEAQAAAAAQLSVFQEYSDAFDTLTQERHLAGQKEYGTLTFLENDVIRMMAEELADTANYCRYQFIKLMMLQAILEEELEGRPIDDMAAKFNEWKGVGDVGWRKA